MKYMQYYIEWKKCRAALLKCLFHVATQAENNRYTLIEQSVHSVLLKIGIL